MVSTNPTQTQHLTILLSDWHILFEIISAFEKIVHKGVFMLKAVFTTLVLLLSGAALACDSYEAFEGAQISRSVVDSSRRTRVSGVVNAAYVSPRGVDLRFSTLNLQQPSRTGSVLTMNCYALSLTTDNRLTPAEAAVFQNQAAAFVGREIVLWPTLRDDFGRFVVSAYTLEFIAM
jgi:hypothetical protein